MSVAELQKIVEMLAISQSETDRQMKETDRKLKELGSLFTNQWGKLVEALLRSGLPKLFRQRGLALTEVSRNVEILDKETGEKRAEIDVYLQNSGEDVAVEVKTTCRPKDVDEHMERLTLLAELIPSYGSVKKLYGAVAALKFESGSDIYAEKQGLYVLKCTDNIATIANNEEFQPKTW